MKTDHQSMMFEAADAAGLTATKGREGWILLDAESGERVSPKGRGYDAQSARAFCEGYQRGTQQGTV